MSLVQALKIYELKNIDNDKRKSTYRELIVSLPRHMLLQQEPKRLFGTLSAEHEEDVLGSQRHLVPDQHGNVSLRQVIVHKHIPVK